MSWRTTGLLFIILAALAGYVYYAGQREELATTPTPAAAAQENIRLYEGVTLEQVSRLDLWREGDEPAAASYSRSDDGEWTRTVPTATLVLSETLNSRVNALLNLTSSRVFLPDETENPPAVYGLAEPAGGVTLVVERDGQAVRYALRIGQATPTGGNLYVQKSGDPRVYIVPDFQINNLLNLIDDPPASVLTD